jgi:Na+/glutamate symporter
MRKLLIALGYFLGAFILVSVIMAALGNVQLPEIVIALVVGIVISVVAVRLHGREQEQLKS